MYGETQVVCHLFKIFMIDMHESSGSQNLKKKHTYMKKLILYTFN